MERLTQEHAAVGFYLSGHPLDDYAGMLRRAGVSTFADVVRNALTGTAAVCRIAGAVSVYDERKSARGTRFAFVKLSDPTGLFEVRMFADVLDVARQHLEPGKAVLLTVVATPEGEDVNLLAKAVTPIDTALAGTASMGLRIFLGDVDAPNSLATRLASAEQTTELRHRGPIQLVLMDPGLPGEIEVDLPGNYPLTPQTIGALKSAPGVVHVEEF